MLAINRPVYLPRQASVDEVPSIWREIFAELRYCYLATSDSKDGCHARHVGPGGKKIEELLKQVLKGIWGAALTDVWLRTVNRDQPRFSKRVHPFTMLCSLSYFFYKSSFVWIHWTWGSDVKAFGCSKLKNGILVYNVHSFFTFAGFDIEIIE